MQILLKIKETGNDFNGYEYTKSINRWYYKTKKVEEMQSSFHLKGLWINQPGEELPSDTLVGSSSYDHRAFEKDAEITHYVSTRD